MLHPFFVRPWKKRIYIYRINLHVRNCLNKHNISVQFLMWHKSRKNYSRELRNKGLKFWKEINDKQYYYFLLTTVEGKCPFIHHERRHDYTILFYWLLLVVLLFIFLLSGWTCSYFLSHPKFKLVKLWFN